MFSAASLSDPAPPSPTKTLVSISMKYGELGFTFASFPFTINIPASVTKVGSHVFSDSGVVSLDLSHVLEIGEFTFDNCKSLKNLKLNSKLKDDFLMEIYPDMMTCPYMQVKWENNQYVYPAGLEFVDTE